MNKPTFKETWEIAKQRGGSLIKRSMQPMGEQTQKYVHKVYAKGSFYFGGFMYHTDSGELVNPIGDVELEMMKLGDMISEQTNKSEK